MNASSTQLSLDYLRGLGYVCEVVERWIPSQKGGQRIRRDFLGIADIIALRDGETVAVQTTTRGQISAHARKIAAAEHIGTLHKAGWRVVIHGWHQPNGPRTRYQMEELELEAPAAPRKRVIPRYDPD